LVEEGAFQQAGFLMRDISNQRPVLNNRAAEACVIWGQLGGWFPERLPLVAAAFGIVYWDGLIDRLLVIRAAIEAARAELS